MIRPSSLLLLVVIAAGGCASDIPAALPEMRQPRPADLEVVRNPCPRQTLCTFSEVITVDARCGAGKIASVTKRIDHYFNYFDREQCKWRRLYLQNDGIEVRQGEQGYCRFTEYASFGEVPEPETAFCEPNPDELNRFCPPGETQSLRLDQWTHRRQFLSCGYYGAPANFPADRVVCE